MKALGVGSGRGAAPSNGPRRALLMVSPRRALLPVLLVFATACGSTVQLQGSEALPRDDGTLSGDYVGQGDGLGSIGAAGSAGQGASSTNDLRATSGEVPLARGNGPVAGVAPSTQPTRGPDASQPATAGRGFTAQTITLGFATANDLGAYGEQFGFEGRDTSQTPIIEAVVRDANARGGIAGRKIVPVYHDLKTADIVNEPDRASEEMCAALTQDNQVFAAVTTVGGLNDELLVSCMAKRNTPLVHVNVTARPQRVYSRYDPYLYAPTTMSLEEMVTSWVGRGDALGYFSKWNTSAGEPGVAPVKVGIAVVCCTRVYGRDTMELASREVARHGQTVAATFVGSDESIGSMSADASSAVLKFRDAGVTHVIANELMSALFMDAAEPQGYRPRYLLHTFQSPADIARSRKAQLKGAVGVGFSPTLDVDRSQDPGDLSPAHSRCKSVMKNAGIDMSSRTLELVAYAYCDGVNLLQTSLNKRTPSVTALRAGAVSVGSLPPSSTFKISFRDQQLHGAGAVRDLTFDSGCSCMKYVSPDHDVQSRPQRS